jgi:dienelactone hydrolase
VSLTVTPSAATYDVPFTIRVTGLRKDERVTLRYDGRSSTGDAWLGQQDARADARGELVVRDEYLIARMRSAHTVPTFPSTVHVAVLGPHLDVTASARRFSAPPSAATIVSLRPARDGFYGDFTRPRDARHHPAILLFGGSEGGIAEQNLAAVLAGHGYPVLELAYFSEPGLPDQLLRIPLEYFRKPLEWLAEQPSVDPQRIVTFGISRGGELSLLLAATYPHLVHGAIGYVPSAWAVPSPVDVHQPAWTLRGRPVLGPIRVEKISGPVFVAGGDDDRLWPSGLSARVVASRMIEHDRRDGTALIYPKAGHALGTALPYQLPVSPVDYGHVSSRYGLLDLGGSPAADEAARESAWPKLLRWLAALGR